jgi:hypothetical protein
MKPHTPFTSMAAALNASSLLFFSTPAVLRAAEIQGTIFDPSMMPVAGAQVAAVNDVGVIVSQITDDQGHYDFNVSPVFENYRLRVTAPGFQIEHRPATGAGFRFGARGGIGYRCPHERAGDGREHHHQRRNSRTQ